MGLIRSSNLSSVLKSVLNWVPAALSVAMIAAESTATMSAANTSHWLLPYWVRFFGPISAAHWAEVHHLIRKTGHFLGYGLVSVSFFHGWRSSLREEGGIRRLWYRASVLALYFTLLASSADEYHQTFLPGRTGMASRCGPRHVRSHCRAARDFRTAADAPWNPTPRVVTETERKPQIPRPVPRKRFLHLTPSVAVWPPCRRIPRRD